MQERTRCRYWHACLTCKMEGHSTVECRHRQAGGGRSRSPARAIPLGTSNMASAHQHPGIIGEYLGKELSLGRMLGPFLEEAQGLPPLHINRFGVIPKGHNTGKWHLITDLSFPPGLSVNDRIDKDVVSLSYITVDEVAALAALAARQGEGALLAEIDIESAYRLIPVHLDDRPLQAMRWQGRVYVDEANLLESQS